MRKAYRYPLLALTLLYLLIVSDLSISLYQYNRAKPCDSPSQISRQCLSVTQQPVVKPTTKETTSGNGGMGSRVTVAGVVVANRHDDSTTTLWLGKPVKNAAAGDVITVVGWNGHYFAAIKDGKTVNDIYWTPGLYGIVLALAFPSILLLAMCLITNSQPGKPLSNKNQLLGGIAFVAYLLTCVVLFISILMTCEMVAKIGL